VAGEDISGTDFIRAIVARDVAAGKNGGRVVTRFPPEPNGYLHIGHAKSICLNFGVASSRAWHLRFDDTNLTAEDESSGDQGRLRWLGFEWGEHEYYASDYFDQLYAFALELIRRGKAFVCDLSSEEIAAYRGTLTEPGRNSPYRDRSVAENLDLFERMKAGEFENGVRTLRAKIDMASPNLVMRDPILYRVHKVAHRTARPGACTRCTTSRTASRTRSRASPTRSARSSSSRAGRSTTGSSPHSSCPSRARGRSSSLAEISRTRSSASAT
jgi:glutaminyl-tRNA synthetase